MKRHITIIVRFLTIFIAVMGISLVVTAKEAWACNNYCQVAVQSGCSPVPCDPSDYNCIQCGDLKTVCCDPTVGTNPDQGGTCTFIDGCACSNGHVVEQGQSCPTSNNNTGYCGDGICTGTCATCPADCGACAVGSPNPSPSPVSNVANGGTCGDGACNDTESCSTCPADCGACAVPWACGNGICDAGESCSSCPGDCGYCSCGNGVCEPPFETCATCAYDCGVCSGAYCGDGTCNGFESCLSCSQDCGTCSNAWWQAIGGSVFSGGTSGTLAVRSNIPTTTCFAPTCKPYLSATDDADTTDSYGMVVTAGGSLAVQGQPNPGDLIAVGTGNARFSENYQYFFRLFSLPGSPPDDFATNAADATKPTVAPLSGKTAYFHEGDLIVQQAWDVGTDKVVVFVHGNLTFDDPSSVGQLITVSPDGFVAFIVSGNITISNNVGNTAVGSSTSNIQAVLIADGTVTIESTGNTATEKRLIMEGTTVGWTNVTLGRDIGDGNSQTRPSEQFVFRPDFVKSLPEEMKRAQYVWQETN